MLFIRMFGLDCSVCTLFLLLQVEKLLQIVREVLGGGEEEEEEDEDDEDNDKQEEVNNKEDEKNENH